MAFWHWYLRRGRIDRRTYWLHYFVPLTVVGVVLEVLALITQAGHIHAATTSTTAAFSFTYGWWVWVGWLLTAVPAWSSQATRLHDRGHSAWWLLWVLLPLAGGIVLLVQMCLPGEPGSNRYGPGPAPRDPVPDAPYPADRY